MLFSRLEYEPQFIALVQSVIGPEDGAAEAARPNADGAQAEGGQAPEENTQAMYNPRVAKLMLELLPSFRNLCSKLRPSMRRLSLEEKRRVRASATPQKSNR